jgi:hypothetical protein
LIQRHGIDEKLFDWTDEITFDHPRNGSRTSTINVVLGVPI